MKIAQIAPLYESVPPRYYGGTERIVSYLTEELVKRGHEVTLFASGDSITGAKLVPASPESLRLDTNCKDMVAHHILMIERLFQSAGEFDIIHNHNDYLPFSLFRRQPVPMLTTLHGRLDLPDLVPLYREFDDMPLASISDAQRSPLPWVNWKGTVYHGLPPDLYRLNEKPADYLAFLGRISPEKRVDHAIEIAKRSGIPLKIAAKVDKADREYFETIRHLFDHPLVEYVGEIGETQKNDFLGNARALLFPIEWPEPFGLVMIEAMACGTPVIARKMGSVPEVMKEGMSGRVFSEIDEAVQAVRKIPASPDARRRCREYFDRRFTSGAMAEAYEKIYLELIEERERPKTTCLKSPIMN